MTLKSGNNIYASKGVESMTNRIAIIAGGSRGFLDERDELLRLVRRKELLRRWQAANMRGLPELPLRWILFPCRYLDGSNTNLNPDNLPSA
jgi:hypothetical protein